MGASGGGCRSEEPTTYSVHVPDGGVASTPACHARPLAVSACGVVEGLPYYAYYDGCNWCTCTRGSTFCTLRGCPSGPEPFQPGGCNPVSYSVSDEELPAGESWVCDSRGRLYRSACAPEGSSGL